MVKKKIKILMHTQPNTMSFNAQDINGRYIASLLDEEEFEIYFINTLDNKIDPKLKKDNIKIIDILDKNKIIRKLKILKYKLLTHYDISFYVRVFKTDSIFLTLKPFFDKKRKTIHMIESMVPYLGDEKYNKWAKFNTLHSDYVFSISKKVQETVKKEYKLDTEIIHVGVDTTIFKPQRKIKKDRLRVVGCGTLSPMKQPILFANIAKLFPEVDFVWIGEGELKKELVALSKEIQNFTLKSNMPHEKLSEYFAQSDVFLFPSLHEGFPKVVIESMACGLPSIVFDRYGPEAVLDNKTGFIVSNEKEMQKKLGILIENKKLREEFSQNAIERAKEFDWKRIVNKWEIILKKAINI